MWTQKFCEVDETNVSYWDNEGKGEIIIFLPGGNTSGMHLKHLDEELNSNVRFIVPDYPGRGKSGSLPVDSNFQNIAKYFIGLFENLKLNNLTLIGHSFGWAVADQIVMQNKNINIKHLIFVDPGEFVWKPLHLPLKILFYLPMHSQKIREFFWRVICNILHIFEYDSISKNGLKDLGEQWMAILNFKITHHRSDISTLLVRSIHDVVIDGHNIDQVKKNYSNNWEIFLPIPHVLDYEDKDGKVKTILFPAIAKEISISILK